MIGNAIFPGSVDRTCRQFFICFFFVAREKDRYTKEKVIVWGAGRAVRVSVREGELWLTI